MKTEDLLVAKDLSAITINVIKVVIERAKKAEAELAELRDAVAWMIEVGSLIKDCESCSPMPARLSVSWVGMEEMYELLDNAAVELRRLAGGEDET